MTDAPAPLVATSDSQLIDDALRWCAAVGATPTLAHDLASARRAWRAASAVIVGDDLVDDLVASSLPRRDHVVVVAHDPTARWQSAMTLGAVAVCGPHEDDRVVELVSAALDGTGEGCIVSVVGGVGGAGASTLTAVLGLAAERRRLRPLVVDADPLGGGLDLVLGAERADGVRWDDFGSTRGRLDAASLSDVLPTSGSVAHLGWTRDSSRDLPRSWPAVLSAAVRAFDLVAVDVPRHLGEQGAEIVGRSVLTVLVVPEEVCAVAASAQVLSAVGRGAPSVCLVSVARPGGIGSAAVEEALGMPVLARIRPDRRLRGVIDRGHGPGRSRSLRRAAGGVLDALGLERS